MDMDTPDNVAGGLAPFVAMTGGIEAVDQYFATLDGLSPQDVQDAARRLLTPQVRTVAILKGVQK
jgi:predicted Zn-dependent peptidase